MPEIAHNVEVCVHKSNSERSLKLNFVDTFLPTLMLPYLKAFLSIYGWLSRSCHALCKVKDSVGIQWGIVGPGTFR